MNIEYRIGQKIIQKKNKWFIVRDYYDQLYCIEWNNGMTEYLEPLIIGYMIDSKLWTLSPPSKLELLLFG